MDEELLKKAEKDCQKIRPPADAPAQAGDGRFGDWKLEQLLGRNSVGELYLATSTGDKCSDGPAALRTLDSSLSRNQRLVKRFLQEAEKAAAVVHPHIARVLDYGRAEDGTAFMVRQFIEGRTLQDALADGLVEVGRAIEILLAVCSALEESAKNELMHRNLTSSNIILGKDGQVYVVDFGLSKGVPPEGRETRGLTHRGEPRDDMRYFSPEQVRDERLDIRSDIYSLGCIMHVLFTGQEIYANLDGYRLLQVKSRGQIGSDAFQSLQFSGDSKARQKAIESVTAIVQRSVSGDKKWRYTSPHELAEDLSRIAKGKELQRATGEAVKEIEKISTGRSSEEGSSVRRANPDGGSSKAHQRAIIVPMLITLIALGVALFFASRIWREPHGVGPVPVQSNRP